MDNIKFKSLTPAVLLEAPQGNERNAFVEVHVTDIEGALLDYLAAKALNLNARFCLDYSYVIVNTNSWTASTNDAIAGPILDQEGIATTPVAGKVDKMWSACIPFANSAPLEYFYGRTRLIAAIRALVAGKLGKTVWICRLSESKSTATAKDEERCHTCGAKESAHVVVLGAKKCPNTMTHPRVMVERA